MFPFNYCAILLPLTMACPFLLLFYSKFFCGLPRFTCLPCPYVFDLFVTFRLAQLIPSYSVCSGNPFSILLSNSLSSIVSNLFYFVQNEHNKTTFMVPIPNHPCFTFVEQSWSPTLLYNFTFVLYWLPSCSKTICNFNSDSKGSCICIR